MLRIRNLGLQLPDFTDRSLFGKRPLVTLLEDINFDLSPGDAVGLVGESGSGKTSLGRTLVGLYAPTSGKILFQGRDITVRGAASAADVRRNIQFIFQDPQSALNPRRRVGDSILQPLRLFEGPDLPPATSGTLQKIMGKVGLDFSLKNRFPHQLSGGQRQRVGIARAIALQPKVLIADEITSGLDVSTQAKILLLLKDMITELNMALVFISHDLSVVRVLCDHVFVMRHGRIVDRGDTEMIFSRPKHAYTRSLLDAIPLTDVDAEWISLKSADITDGNTVMANESNNKAGTNWSNECIFVTGANRGIGAALVEALLTAGAGKIYAAARDPKLLQPLKDRHGARIQSVALDITDSEAVAAAAAQCRDVTVLCNIAGINRLSAFAKAENLDAARAEMEVNYFGTLAMCRAFAPHLKANGGGSIVNMLSILAHVTLPLMGSLTASKAAALRMTDGLRAELSGQGTHILAVLPGAVDTDMSRDFPPPKMPAADVATAIVQAIEKRETEIFPGDMAAGLKQGLAANPEAVKAELAQLLP